MPALALGGHFDSVERVAFSSDGRFVASAGMDGSVRVWDVTGLPGGSDAGQSGGP